ncbi:hypothetical protein SGRIM119S_01763 [Streptomyces griseorubiginosus]
MFWNRFFRGRGRFGRHDGARAAACGHYAVRFYRRGGPAVSAAERKGPRQGGHTPVIRVRGRSQCRFSIAALACYKKGERLRLIYRPKRHVDHRQGGRRSFIWPDYRDLLIVAHQQLGAPIVLVWDNCETHGAPCGVGSDPGDNWPRLPC